MLYCVEGKGWIDTNGKKIQAKKGDMLFCTINKTHGYGADNTDPWSIHWAHFVGDGVEELLKILCISEEDPVIHIGERPEIIGMMKKIYNILSFGYSFANLFYSATCFQEIFSFIIRLKLHSDLRSPAGIDVDDVINHMIKNTNSTFTLEQLAQYANMSKFHFLRKFKHNTGYSPIEYFNRLKIQKACELLDTTLLEVKEISSFLGFNNPLYFSEVFKKIVGISPIKYRNVQRSFCDKT